MRKYTQKVYGTDSKFIDPANCGSMVAYVITGRRRLSGTVHLSDCNRKIEWYFSNEDEAVKKIDCAIQILANFRLDFINARKNFGRNYKKRK